MVLYIRFSSGKCNNHVTRGPRSVSARFMKVTGYILGKKGDRRSKLQLFKEFIENKRDKCFRLVRAITRNPLIKTFKRKVLI